MLTQLDLSHNHLTSHVAHGLSEALHNLPHLSSCSVAHNNLGSETGGAVLEALLEHPSLRTADLSATNLCNCSVRMMDPEARTLNRACV